MKSEVGFGRRFDEVNTPAPVQRVGGGLVIPFIE